MEHIPKGVEVIRRPITEPYGFYKRLSGQKEKINPTIFADDSKKSLAKIFFLWIRGNVFIPDPRVLWIKPSVQYLSNYIATNHVDAIISTGPPHSMHLIARNLKRKLKIPWLADFRDPWTQIYFFDQMHMSLFAKKYHRSLEKSVLNEADIVVTVSKHCKKGLQEICNRPVEVVTNGFEEFEIKTVIRKDNKVRMLYAGALSLDRNPKQFWRILENFLQFRTELKSRFELWLIGNVDKSIIDELKTSGLSTMLHVLPSMPHSELQTHLSSADILLLIGVPENPGVVTGKLFEYLYLKKPIFSISPKGSDVVEILEQTNSGYNADFNDELQLFNNLKLVFEDHENNLMQTQSGKVELYSRKNLTSAMAALLDKLDVK